METELKTLKDFGPTDINCGEYEDDTVVEKKELKQVGINYYKFMEKTGGGKWTVKDFIAWFFDLTSEDLK